MLREGQWDELLDAMTEPHPFRKCGSRDAPPATPGLITKASAKRIQNAAENGRVGAAWRQLWSYGIAPSSEQTMQAMLSKWKTLPQDPCRACPTASGALTHIASARIATLDRLNKASQ
eukprot:4702111-Amphidinium_carterae.1